MRKSEKQLFCFWSKKKFFSKGTLNLQVPVTLSYFIICTVHQHFKLYCSYVINQDNIIPAVIKNRCRQDTGIHHYSTCKVKHNLTYSSKNWVFFSSSGIAPSRPIEVDNDSLSPNHNSGHKLKGQGHEIFDLKKKSSRTSYEKAKTALRNFSFSRRSSRKTYVRVVRDNDYADIDRYFEDISLNLNEWVC